MKFLRVRSEPPAGSFFERTLLHETSSQFQALRETLCLTHACCMCKTAALLSSSLTAASDFLPNHNTRPKETLSPPLAILSHPSAEPTKHWYHND